jgi:hypothetical protein
MNISDFVKELSDENDIRFLLILNNEGFLWVIPEDSFDESYSSDFFLELQKAPNYFLLNIKNVGVGTWIFANPYCEQELAEQVYAFLSDNNRYLDFESPNKFLLRTDNNEFKTN